MLAALCYAVAGVYGRRFAGMTPMVTAAGQVTASAIFMVPLALCVDQPWHIAPPGPSAWSAVVGLAILSTALAYCIYFAILKAAGATNLMLVTFLVPASAILLGLLFLNERLTATDVRRAGRHRGRTIHHRRADPAPMATSPTPLNLWF